jgi:hypothetical protein
MCRRGRKDIRDFQRKRLYDAENRVSEGPVRDSLVAAQQCVDRLLASPWWRRHFPSVRCVVLFQQRGNALAHKGVHGGRFRSRAGRAPR